MAADPPPPESKLTAPALRPLYLMGGLALVGLGVLGAFMPIMPSTIFFILAVACFARSSPKLETWLLTHKTFGPPIIAWRESGAIPRKVKVIAVGSMIASMAIICLSPAPQWVDWLAATIIVASAAFVITRPEKARPKLS